VFFAVSTFLSINASIADRSEAIALNARGVEALDRVHQGQGYADNLCDGDWQNILDMFQASLKSDPNYRTARRNLGIAHNNFALYLASHEHKYNEALKQLHQATYIDPDNVTTGESLTNLIERCLRLNPNRFADRVELGDSAKEQSDLEGAVVEYNAALKLKHDQQVYGKLAKVYRLLKQDDKAAVEDEASRTNTGSAGSTK